VTKQRSIPRIEGDTERFMVLVYVILVEYTISFLVKRSWPTFCSPL
jgi:hypothetical protein